MTPDDNLLLLDSLSQLLTTHLALTATLIITVVAWYVRGLWRKVLTGRIYHRSKELECLCAILDEGIGGNMTNDPLKAIGLILPCQTKPPRLWATTSCSALSKHPMTYLATLIVVLVAHYVIRPWRKVPPGPKGLPILGNALQLQNKGWMFERECKQKFGPSKNFFLPTP